MGASGLRMARLSVLLESYGRRLTPSRSPCYNMDALTSEQVLAVIESSREATTSEGSVC